MKIKRLTLPGVLQIHYDSFSDHRGKICTTFDVNLSKYLKEEVEIAFTHDKFVVNKKNVMRGIHYDTETSKLVTCLSGRISQYVICVDENSPHFGKYEVIEMGPLESSILIPCGYGNAFISREENSLYHYKLAYSGPYVDIDKQYTIKWNDPRFDIPWGGENFILSDRDK